MNYADRQRVYEQVRRDHPLGWCDVSLSAADASVFQTSSISLTRSNGHVSRLDGAGAMPRTHMIDVRSLLLGRMDLRLALFERRRPGERPHGKKNVGRRIAPRGDSGCGRQWQPR